MSARQIPFDLVHRPAYSREDFLVSASNAEIVGWIDRWPDWKDPVLVIWGPLACGKTHLLHVWKEKSRAEEFHGQKEGRAFFVDDADRLAGNRADETALFHLYNRLKGEGGHLLLTAAQPPARWGIVTPDLASRLSASPAVEMKAPDEALLSAVMLKQFSDRQIEVGSDVISFLVTRMERSFAAAGQWVERLDKAALAQKRKISVALARELMEKSF